MSFINLADSAKIAAALEQTAKDGKAGNDKLISGLFHVLGKRTRMDKLFRVVGE